MHYLPKRRNSRTASGVAALMLLFAQAYAAEFSVAPIRLDLGSAARSGAFVVRNESQQKISFQLEATEWTQDMKGADQYSGTADLIFFPKILGVEPGEEGVVRVGLRKPVVPVEKAYRLFIQELPNPNQGSNPVPAGPQVHLLMRFGAPIFVAPLQVSDDAEYTNAAMERSALNLSVKNTGNRHLVIEGIHVRGLGEQGQELFALTLADRYLLAGSTKTFNVSVPAETCRHLAEMTMELKTDKLSRTRKLGVSRENCQ